MKTDVQKTALPKPAPFIWLFPGVKATLLHDFDRFSNGSMLMKYADTVSKLTEDDGSAAGEMGTAMGGTLFVSIGRREWSIDRIALFEHFRKMEKEQYLGAANGEGHPKA